MPTTPFLPLPDGLEITAISETLEGLLISVTSHRNSSACPLCGTPSGAVHSYYRRRPLDLPCAGQAIRLQLSVRKFFCRVSTCKCKVFTERLPELLAPSSRMTARLRTVAQAIGFAFNGQGGARLSTQLGREVSRVSIIKSLYLVPAKAVRQVKEVGIDDFAWKRGKRYGTIILDLQTHKILDLLPDREAKSVREWLLAHPEVGIVSRDRGGAYADGAAQGAPQAIQVADRWHLCQNLGDAIEAYLVRKRLKMAPPSLPSVPPQVEVILDASTQSKKTEPEQRMQARREHKGEQHEHIRQLALQGMSIHGIARHLGITRNTVRVHLRMGEELVVAERPKKHSILDPSYDSIVERWRQGCTNGQQIFREIRAKGYRGSATTVRTITTRLRKNLSGMVHPPKHSSEGKSSASPRELRWLLAKCSTDLSVEEKDDLARFLESSEEVKTVYQLLQDFLQMLRERRADRRKAWVKAAQHSGIKELRSFVAGIERDFDAVSAGLSLPWSQGVVEGTMNKLKTHKRLMYGRASFHLLRQKLLHPI